MQENIFEYASRKAIRFATKRGILSVEDLWNLPLTSDRNASLDSVAVDLSKKIESTTKSFVTESTTPAKELQISFEIVKHIIGVKKAENAAAKLKADKLAQKDRLLELIAKKQDEQLAGKSMEELQAAVEALAS